MKTSITIYLAALCLGLCGCAEQEPKANATEVSPEAAVQAEAARQVMQALPKAFQTPDYFKKNDPAPGAESPQKK